MTDELRNKVNDWMAFRNTGDATLADGLYGEDYVRYDPTTPGSGPELIKAYVGMVREGFPDLRFVLEETIIEAERVCARWSATGFWARTGCVCTTCTGEQRIRQWTVVV